MIPKNTSHMDITLNKSPSGTWKAPDFRKLQFKPWQRLWFATAIIYLLLLAGSCQLIMPNQESIERRMVLSVTEEVHRYDGMAFVGESPRTIFETARSQGYAAWITQLRSKYRIGPEGNAGFDKIEREYRDSISDLPMKRTVGIVICIVVWAIPMAVLYAMGTVIDWIKRGIRDIQG